MSWRWCSEQAEGGAESDLKNGLKVMLRMSWKWCSFELKVVIRVSWTRRLEYWDFTNIKDRRWWTRLWRLLGTKEWLIELLVRNKMFLIIFSGQWYCCQFRLFLMKWEMDQYISNNKHVKHIEAYVNKCRWKWKISLLYLLDTWLTLNLVLVTGSFSIWWTRTWTRDFFPNFLLIFP